MRRSLSLVALIAGGVLMHAADVAHARKGSKDDLNLLQPAPLQPVPAESFQPRNAPGLSPDRAAREIERRHGGRVLGVQADGSGYRVKMLKDGEVRIYQVGP